MSIQATTNIPIPNGVPVSFANIAEQAGQASSNSTTSNAPSGEQTPSSDFATSLRSQLVADQSGAIHEEQLQHGIVSVLLARDNPAAAEVYDTSVAQALASGASFEDAVKVGLQQAVSSGALSQGDAEKINGISFRAAQLDSNLSMLYDNRGSSNDPTIAVAPLDQAIAKAQAALLSLESGELSVTARALNAPSNASSNAAPSVASSSGAAHGGGGSSGAGFLWKPQSEADGNLVVLLPSQLTGNVSSAAIYAAAPDGSEPVLLEQGRFAGDNHNGNRAHFRFGRPGGAYPDGSIVIATTKTGAQVEFAVGETSARNS